jgi:hypothetical protein
MAVIRGKDFKLYRNTDSPYDNSPTWALVPNVKDLTRNLEKTLADASVRGSTFRQQVGTMKDLSLDFQMVYDPTDSDVTAFETAFFADGDVEILVLDGLISASGSKGLRFMAQVTNFTVNEALEDVGLVDVTLVPGYYPTNLPRRVSVVTPGSVTDA